MGKSVQDAMTTQPTFVERSKPVKDAARIMRDENVGALPVVDDGRLIGMITDRDIAVRVVAEGRDLGSTTVGDAHTDQLVTVQPEQDLDDALALMARYQVRRVPVTDGDRLVGILAQADVALDMKEKVTGEVVQAISEPSGSERR
jgi:CBS domain-containing protein